MIELALDDGIALVTFANPPVNAMDAGFLEHLTGLFDRLAADPGVRAAVLTGQGVAFSAGLNLKTTPQLDLAGQHRLIAALNDSFGTLYAWPKPLVAAVNGHAIAGGMIAALCADWRIAADVPLEASLAEIHVGVTFPVAALQIARAELAPDSARRMILLGQPLDMFDERVPSADLVVRAVARAKEFAALPPQAYATTKRELRAVALARIAEARAGNDPRYARWLGDEMTRAAAAAIVRPGKRSAG